MLTVTRKPPRRTGPLPKGIPLTTARKKTLYGKRLVMLQKHLPLDICWVVDKLTGKQERTIHYCIQCGCNTMNFHAHHWQCPILLFSRHLRPSWLKVLGTTSQGNEVIQKLSRSRNIPYPYCSILLLKHEQRKVRQPSNHIRICGNCNVEILHCCCPEGTIQTIGYIPCWKWHIFVQNQSTSKKH